MRKAVPLDVAILAEYNPFSPGHAWQLQEIRRHLGGKTRIGVFMTQYLTQRGDLALLSPKARAAQALVSGADLVLGLPNQTTLVAAPDFARHFWATVSRLGSFDYVAFSAETPDPTFFDCLSTKILEEKNRYEAYLQEALAKQGYFLAARLEAYNRLHGSSAPSTILQEPNNILALEYYLARKTLAKAPDALKLPQILLLPRQGQGEGAGLQLLGPELNPSASLPPSASQIRKLCVHCARPGIPPLDFASLIPRLAPSYPVEAFAILCYGLAQQRQLASLEALGPFLFPTLEHKAKALSLELLKDPVLARLARAKISDFPTLSELVGALASKSLPQTRVRRTLLRLALGLMKDDPSAKAESQSPKPALEADWEEELPDTGAPVPYLRLLGATQEGRHMLHRMKGLEGAKKPIIAGSVGRFLDANDPQVRELARKDYEMSQMVRRAIGLSRDEFFNPPLFLKRARRKDLLTDPDLAKLLI